MPDSEYLNPITAKSSYLPTSPANRIQLLFHCKMIRFSRELANYLQIEDVNLRARVEEACMGVLRDVYGTFGKLV